MTKLYLLDPRSDIFQSFQDANQLFAFANRSSRNFNGRILIVRNGDKSRVVDLRTETPIEINALVVKLQNEIR